MRLSCSSSADFKTHLNKSRIIYSNNVPEKRPESHSEYLQMDDFCHLLVKQALMSHFMPADLSCCPTVPLCVQFLRRTTVRVRPLCVCCSVMERKESYTALTALKASTPSSDVSKATNVWVWWGNQSSSSSRFVVLVGPPTHCCAVQNNAGSDDSAADLRPVVGQLWMMGWWSRPTLWRSKQQTRFPWRQTSCMHTPRLQVTQFSFLFRVLPAAWIT